jgi:RimJ/RimL family protein N-acetyltransferase
MRLIPELHTDRLVVSELVMDDLAAVHRILDKEAFPSDTTLDERSEWLQWTVLNYKQLGKLFQPPYGDRGFALKETGELIGVVGVVPHLKPFGQLPFWGNEAAPKWSTEMGLFWGTSTAHQGEGYATEAARAVIDYLFTHEQLGRIVANTDYDNLASQAVMKKLGMTLNRNPQTDPPWLQIMGILENIMGPTA